MSKRSDKLFANRDNVPEPKLPTVEAPLTEVERETVLLIIKSKVEAMESKNAEESSRLSRVFCNCIDSLCEKYDGKGVTLAIFNLSEPYHKQLLS